MKVFWPAPKGRSANEGDRYNCSQHGDGKVSLDFTYWDRAAFKLTKQLWKQIF